MSVIASHQLISRSVLTIYKHFLPRDAMQSTVSLRQVVCPFVCLSVTLRYPDHIGWKVSKLITGLVSVGCSLSTDSNITSWSYSKGNTLKFWSKMTQPHPCWIIERYRHSIANCGGMFKDSATAQRSQWRAYRKETTIALSNGAIADPLQPPFP